VRVQVSTLTWRAPQQQAGDFLQRGAAIVQVIHQQNPLSRHLALHGKSTGHVGALLRQGAHLFLRASGARFSQSLQTGVLLADGQRAVDVSGCDAAPFERVHLVFIRAMSGETTRVSPSRKSAPSWKTSDLPAPVGMTTSVCRPSRSDCSASACPGRKEGKPK
jgi:hypothetical protein